MKRFITAMLFSLTVIVCEQQTLFAPHYTDYGGVTDFTSDTTNSLVPVAGVDRSVPVAGTGDSLIAIIAIAAPQVDKDLNIMDPTDCPNIMDPTDCPSVVYPDDRPTFIDDMRYEKGAYPNRHKYRCYSCGICGD